jgi:hypothetical protein
MNCQVAMYPGARGGGEGRARWAVYLPMSRTWRFAQKPGKRHAEKLASALRDIR